MAKLLWPKRRRRKHRGDRLEFGVLTAVQRKYVSVDLGDAAYSISCTFLEESAVYSALVSARDSGFVVEQQLPQEEAECLGFEMALKISPAGMARWKELHTRSYLFGRWMPKTRFVLTKLGIATAAMLLEAYTGAVRAVIDLAVGIF